MGNLLTSFKNCFGRKPNEEYASFIDQDNLLLDDIQNRVNDYNLRTNKIEDVVNNMKKGYTSLINDLKKELLELRQEYNHLNTSHNSLNKEMKTMVILNKAQEEKINDLESKLINMESESIFLEDSNVEESNYMDVRSNLINS